MNLASKTTFLFPILLFLISVTARADQVTDDDKNNSNAEGPLVQLRLMSSGAMRKVGHYMPQRIELSPDKPPVIAKSPADLTTPLYGQLPIGYPAHEGDQPPTFLVIVDEPPGKEARLFVDTNRNGDLTDDPASLWVSRPYQDAGKQYRQFRGAASIDLGNQDSPRIVSLIFERYDATDPRRTALMNSLFYCRDYACQGEITLAGKSYQSMLVDEQTTGDFRSPRKAPGEGVRLLLDINANGKFERQGESFDTHEPFNIGGVTYEITDMAPDGSSFRIVISSKSVVEIPAPPAPADPQIGKPIAAFEATQMDGKTVKFPSDYKGKLVLIDFWATWCHPCMMEVPTVVKAYEAFHDKGFEILGVTLDSENSVEKINSVAQRNHMTWPQVYDGGGWNSRVPQLYSIRSIPQAFLVDGDTGEILATGGTLRGDTLISTIQSALAKKTQPQSK